MAKPKPKWLNRQYIYNLRSERNFCLKALTTTPTYSAEALRIEARIAWINQRLEGCEELPMIEQAEQAASYAATVKQAQNAAAEAQQALKEMEELLKREGAQEPEEKQQP